MKTGWRNRLACGRFTALTLLALLVLGVIRIPGAAAADRLTVRLDWITQPMHMPFFLAVQRGWFKAADLDVAIEDGNGSTTTVQLVGAGRFDIGFADLSPMAIAKSKGLPVTSVAGIIRKGGMGLIVPTASRITKLSDLIGKTIIYTAGSLEGPFVEPFFRRNGIPVDKIRLLNVQASAKISLYLAGRADAVISTVPPQIPIAKGKRDSKGLLFADYGFNLPGFGLVVQPQTLKDKGAAVRRFASIVCGAWTYILNNPRHMQEAARAVRAARPNSPLSEAMLIAQAEAYRPYFYTDATKGAPIGIQTAADWAVALTAMQEAKVIPSGANPTDYFTNDYLDLASIQKFAKAADGR